MESRVLRASSKTLHLHLAKMPWLNRHLAKEAASCDILVPNPKYTGLFSKSRPKNHLSWGACLLWKSSFLWELLSKLVMRRGLRQPLCIPEDSMSCSTRSWWLPQLLIRARFSCLSQVGHTRRQEVRPGTFTSLSHSCLLTVRLTFSADKDISARQDTL